MENKRGDKRVETGKCLSFQVEKKQQQILEAKEQ